MNDTKLAGQILAIHFATAHCLAKIYHGDPQGLITAREEMNGMLDKLQFAGNKENALTIAHASRILDELFSLADPLSRGAI